MIMNIIVFVLIGAAAGILSGLFGIGGGIVIIPAYGIHTIKGTRNIFRHYASSCRYFSVYDIL